MEHKQKKVYNSILEIIGHTPMIKLNKILQEEGVECEILAKCEFLNPTGSHKDRLAFGLIQDAEVQGKLKEGGTIVEATSGNTGVGLSFVGAVKGYKVIAVALPKSSSEKCDYIRGFGARVIRAKTNLSKDPDGIGPTAERVTKEIPGAYMTAQFSNKANPATHDATTAIEIYDQCEGKIDYFFMSAGTGGTITGCGRTLKKKIPGIKIIGCDPIGSVIGGGVASSFLTEGVGYDYVPENVDLTVMDEWIKFSDKDAFLMARRLMKTEGLSVGESAGGILWAAIKYSKEKKLTKAHRLVIILPDTGRNYLSKILNNEWMLERGFIDEAEYRNLMEVTDKKKQDEKSISCLKCNPIPVLNMEKTIKEVWTVLKGSNVILVNSSGKEEDKNYKGIITCRDALMAINAGKYDFTNTIEKIMKTELIILPGTIKVSTAMKFLETRDNLLFYKEPSKEVCMLTLVDLMEIIEN